jgi:hypothetical protein
LRKVIAASASITSRQPKASAAAASGEAPITLPAEPKPISQEVRMASRAGLKLRAKMKTDAISTGEQPMPISVMAAITIQGWLATAKSSAPPPPPSASSTAAVRRGP